MSLSREDRNEFDRDIANSVPFRKETTQKVSNNKKSNKYNRECKGVIIDVYDVLQAFDVKNPALQHLVKKALCVGIRGHKTKEQDLKDIIDSSKRAIELEK
jgi:hypothetical protein